MQFSLSTRYTDTEHRKVYCFNHAVQLAVRGVSIEVEVDEFGMDENDMRSTVCMVCSNEVLVEAAERAD